MRREHDRLAGIVELRYYVPKVATGRGSRPVVGSSRNTILTAAASRLSVKLY
jgi:hypothetical protein